MTNYLHRIGVMLICRLVPEGDWFINVEIILSVVPVTRYVKYVAEGTVEALESFCDPEAIARHASSSISEQTKFGEVGLCRQTELFHEVLEIGPIPWWKSAR